MGRRRAALIIVLLWRPELARIAVLAVPAVVVVTLLTIESLGAGVTWSPYYKVVTTEHQANGFRVISVSVNGVPHQNATDAETKARLEPRYALPYERMSRSTPGRVLIVGAGTGTDVALALSRGATSVDAVEIDPRLQQIGAQRHPDQPYQDPRVHVHIDDGRAFLERSSDKYDLIIFALPDSLTLVAGASSLRLESYLFTVEAMQSVRDHLAPGRLVLDVQLLPRGLAGRSARPARSQEAFGHEPCVDTLSGVQAVISAGLTGADQRCGTPGDPGRPGTGHRRPPVRLPVRALDPARSTCSRCSACWRSACVSVRVVGGPLRRMRPYVDLFFLGAAFLLLETRSITGFALLFGTTWIVNAIVFAGVLLVVLAAVEVTRRWRTPPLIDLYAALAGALLLAGLLPTRAAARLPGGPACGRGGRGRVPADLRARTSSSPSGSPRPRTRRSAFAANLLGAMVGGCLEYLSLIVGYQALLLLAALLYGCALFAGRGRLGCRWSPADRGLAAGPVRCAYSGDLQQGRSPMDSRNPVLNREFSDAQLATFHEPPPSAARSRRCTTGPEARDRSPPRGS